MDQKNRTLSSALASVAMHLWMRSYEPKSIRKTICSLILLTTPLIGIYNTSIGELYLKQTYLTFISALLSSMVFYRVSPFHALSKIPGPLINKITRLPLAYQALGGKTPDYYQNLHDGYGRVVRIGPNEISTNDFFYVPDVLGGSGMQKRPMLEHRRLIPAKDRDDHNYLLGVRDLQRHAQLRKPWNKAFGARPMEDYEAVVLRRAGARFDCVGASNNA